MPKTMFSKKRKRLTAFVLCDLMAAMPFQAFAEEGNVYYGETVSQAELLSEEVMDGSDEIIVDDTEPDLTQRFPYYNNPKKPAPMGIWLKSYRLAYADSEDHEVYFRVTELVSGEETLKDIDAFNAASATSYIGELTDPYLSYYEILYDVYYPEDYPTGTDGYIVDPTLSFSIANPEGGGFVTERGIYVGLSKVEPIMLDDEEQGLIEPGMVYHGKAVFAMLNDGTDYVLEYACRQSEPDGEVIYQYSKIFEKN